MSSHSYQLPLLRLGIEPDHLRQGAQVRAPEGFLDEVITQYAVARHRAGLHCADLDFRIGCADKLVQKWETGMRMPSGFMMWCWAKALNRRIVLL